MTNFGALAILALRKDHNLLLPDLCLLIALETVTAADDGSRSIGMKLLASKAGVPYGTARAARDRLRAAGLICCTAGTGRGHFTSWVILLPLKVPAQDEHLSQGAAATNPDYPQGAPATNPENGQRCSAEPLKVPDPLAKGARRNAAASGNANTGLEESGLNESGLPAAQPQSTAEVEVPEKVRSKPRHQRRQDTPNPMTRQGTEAERKRQADALTQWMLDHPEACSEVAP